MDNVAILEELLKLEKEKKAHLDQYKEMIRLMAESGNGNTFFQGGCDKCDSLDNRISQLKSKLK